MKGRILLVSILISALVTLPGAQTMLAQGPEPFPSVPYGMPGGELIVAAQGQNVQISGIIPQPAISGPPTSENVGLVGQIGGSVFAVDIRNSYAYIGVGPRLEILDISNPANPSVVGQTEVLPGLVADIEVAEAGGKVYAYVAASGGGLRIIDVTDPAHPNEIGFYDTPGNAYGVAVVGNYAYIADRWEGLRVIDISNPASPFESGYYLDSKFAIEKVALSDHYAYVVGAYVECDQDGCQWIGRFGIIDVSDPTNPVGLGFYNTPGELTGVAVAGNHAYVAELIYREDSQWKGGGLRIFDVSAPGNPQEVGFYDTPGYPGGVAIAGDYAFLADSHEGIRIIDITDPANPDEVGSYNTMGQALDVVVTDSYAYVADYTGFCIINVSNPENPAEVGRYGTSGSASGVAVAGDHAYIASNAGLRIIDISNPRSPSELGSFAKGAYDVTVVGNYAYIAGGDPYLRIIDISDPANPNEVGSYETPGRAYGVAIAGDYAYIADWDAGLRIIDVSDPTNPNEVGHFDTSGYATSVAISGTLAYVADGWQGLRIIDVSNPISPAEVGYFDTDWEIYDVAVVGHYAYVAEPPYWDGHQYVGGGLRIIDVSDPAHPTEVGLCNTPGFGWRVTAVGDYAYLAAFHGGLRVIDVSDPTNPTEIGYYETLGYAVDVVMAESYTYIAEYDGGLSILHFRYIPIMTTVGAGGGTFEAYGDRTTYTFPTGTFTDTVVITHTALFADDAPPTGNLADIGHFFEITAVYSDTGKPAQLALGQTYTITIQYTADELGAVTEDTLGLYWWNGSTWSQEGITSTVDAENNRITAQVGHLSLFTVLGKIQVYLPLVLRNT